MSADVGRPVRDGIVGVSDDRDSCTLDNGPPGGDVQPHSDRHDAWSCLMGQASHAYRLVSRRSVQWQAGRGARGRKAPCEQSTSWGRRKHVPTVRCCPAGATTYQCPGALSALRIAAEECIDVSRGGYHPDPSLAAPPSGRGAEAHRQVGQRADALRRARLLRRRGAATDRHRR